MKKKGEGNGLGYRRDTQLRYTWKCRLIVSGKKNTVNLACTQNSNSCIRLSIHVHVERNRMGTSGVARVMGTSSCRDATL